MPQNTNTGISDEIIRDVDELFDNDQSIYRVLRTNNKTWKAYICAKKGVKAKTARKIVREFLKLLRNISLGGFHEDGIDREYGQRLVEKYKDHIISLDATPFLVEVPAPRSP